MDSYLFSRRRAERFAQLLDEANGGRRHHVRSRADDQLAALVAVGQRLSADRPAVEVDTEFRTGLRAMLRRHRRAGGHRRHAPSAGRPDAPARRRRRARLAAGGRPPAGPGPGAPSWSASPPARIALSGISAASENAVPGDALYGMKRSTERAQLALASSDLSRGQLFLDFARTRLDEAATLRGDRLGFSAVLDDMDADTRQGVRLLTTAAAQRADPAALDAVDTLRRRASAGRSAACWTGPTGADRDRDPPVAARCSTRSGSAPTRCARRSPAACPRRPAATRSARPRPPAPATADPRRRRYRTADRRPAPQFAVLPRPRHTVCAGYARRGRLASRRSRKGGRVARTRKVTVSTDAARAHRRLGGDRAPAAPVTPADPTAAAFFDVDNTMMQGASIYCFARGLAARKYFTTGDLARFAWQQAPVPAARHRARRATCRRPGRPRWPSSQGWRVDDVERLAEEIFDELMADRIWAGTRALAQRHLDAGQRVWLVTAAPVELGRVIAAAARPDRRARHGRRGRSTACTPAGWSATCCTARPRPRRSPQLAAVEGWTWPAAPPTATRPTTCRCSPRSAARWRSTRTPRCCGRPASSGWEVRDFRTGRKAAKIAVPGGRSAPGCGGRRAVAAGLALHRRRARRAAARL